MTETMTSWETAEDELTAIIEASIDTMEEQGLAPRDWDVYVDEGELWANVWFEAEPTGTLADRKANAMKIVQAELRERDTVLPVTVNANYQVDVTEDGIACWWSK